MAPIPSSPRGWSHHHLSGGAIHAAAIGSHAETPPAAAVFTAAAVFQLTWGALALVRRDKAMALIGALGNAALFAGWVLAKWKGLSIVDGLDKAEPAQMADTTCAVLALLSGFAAAAVFFGWRPRLGRPVLAGAAAAALPLVAVPGMVKAGRHHHEGGATSVVVVQGKTRVVTVTQPVPPKPYDPALPIDLGGVKGVTPAQQARPRTWWPKRWSGSRNGPIRKRLRPPVSSRSAMA